MKLYHVVLGLLLVVVFCTPVAAQEGLTDGERIARLEGAYEHLASKVDVERVQTEVERVRTEVESVRTEVVALRSEIHAAVQTTRVIFAGFAGFLALVLGGAQVWIVLMLREWKSRVPDG
ncbi:MAG: hypothetical protein F4X62_01725 [Caldilineaceae bacterium SB0662_bin_25]|nr:hypothetical protein [Caldilineaceae bacterium SB0662_bin_25]